MDSCGLYIGSVRSECTVTTYARGYALTALSQLSKVDTLKVVNLVNVIVNHINVDVKISY